MHPVQVTSQSHRYTQTNTFTFTTDNLEFPVHLTFMSLYCLRKLEHLEKTHREHAHAIQKGPSHPGSCFTLDLIFKRCVHATNSSRNSFHFLQLWKDGLMLITFASFPCWPACKACLQLNLTCKITHQQPVYIVVLPYFMCFLSFKRHWFCC